MLEFGLIFKQSNSHVGTEGLKSGDLHTEPHMSKTDESPQDGVRTSGRKEEEITHKKTNESASTHKVDIYCHQIIMDCAEREGREITLSRRHAG